MSSFTKKQLRVTIMLATPGATFAGTDSNTMVQDRLRVIALVTAVARSATSADIRIFGMKADDMNALSVIWFNQPVVQNNLCTLEASEDDGASWSQVFSGNIVEAAPDYNAMPNVSFHIQANVGYTAKITSVAAQTFAGSMQVATIAEKLAKQMGFAFENNNVTASLSNQYLPGTAYDQLVKVCQASDTDFYFIPNAQLGMQGTLAIVPSGLGRSRVPVTVLNAKTGLQGYPIIERFGVTLLALWNPNFMGGASVQVTNSDVPAGNATWTPFAIVHELESQNPRGKWQTRLQCTKYGTPAPNSL